MRPKHNLNLGAVSMRLLTGPHFFETTNVDRFKTTTAFQRHPKSTHPSGRLQSKHASPPAREAGDRRAQNISRHLHNNVKS